MAIIPSLVVAGAVSPPTSAAIAALPDMAGQSITVQILYGVGVFVGAAGGAIWLFMKNFKTPPPKAAGLVLDTAEFADLRPFYEVAKHAAKCSEYLEELSEKFDTFIKNQDKTIALIEARERREEIYAKAQELAADMVKGNTPVPPRR